MEDNQKNTIIAIVLSLVVVLGWQILFVEPKIEAQKKAQELQSELEANDPMKEGVAKPTPDDASDIPSMQNSGAGVATQDNDESAAASRDQALATTKRVKIETDRITGSINLTGARVDDIHLVDYHETIDKTSPTIILLSPSTAPGGFFAEFGFVAEGTKVPGPSTQWQQDGNNSLTVETPIVLKWQNTTGAEFTRTISIDENYMLTFRDEVENKGADALSIAPYGRVIRYGEPKTEGVYVIHEGLIGVVGESNLEEVSYEDLRDDGPVKPEKADKGWVGITDKYWGATVIPASSFQAKFAYFGQGRPRYQADYLADKVEIAPGASHSVEQRLFAGAKETAVIDQYEQEYSIQNFDLLIDWGWFYFLTKPMFKALDWIYKLVGNFGVAMLIITVVIKLLFLPLANLSYASMAKMKKLQPELEAIKKNHAEDRVAQQQAMMALYKKEKINPAAGCWPMLIQIPVFFSIYKVLYVTIEMRHAPFFGWIQDLAAPDPTSLFNLFGLLPFDPPFGIMIGIWPLLMGITMFLQMRMNPTPPDPTQQMIFTWMPVVFTFMLASFPAGLVIYWAWNNTLSIIQQGIIMKRHGVKIELWDNLRGLFSRKSKSDKAEDTGGKE